MPLRNVWLLRVRSAVRGGSESDAQTQLERCFESFCFLVCLFKTYMQLSWYKELWLNHMEEKTIQSISVLPLALMSGLIGAVIGLLIGIFYAVVFGAIFSTIPSSTLGTGVFDFGWFSIIFGVAAIIIMPIIGFIAGLIQGALVAVLYNFFAPRIGGIKFRFKEESHARPQS